MTRMGKAGPRAVHCSRRRRARRARSVTPSPSALATGACAGSVWGVVVTFIESPWLRVGSVVARRAPAGEEAQRVSIAGEGAIRIGCCYGTVTVAPSPVALMVKVPLALEA